MERARRVRMLVSKAKGLIEQDGDRALAVETLDEALRLLERIEHDMRRFEDVLAAHLEELRRED